MSEQNDNLANGNNSTIDKAVSSRKEPFNFVEVSTSSPNDRIKKDINQAINLVNVFFEKSGISGNAKTIHDAITDHNLINEREGYPINPDHIHRLSELSLFLSEMYELAGRINKNVERVTIKPN